MCRAIRQDIFSKRIPYNVELARIVREDASHRFLVNPASQNTYLYQVEFVCELSQRLLNKPLADLSVLDWGCGKGHVTFLLKQRGANVRSCDYRAFGEQDEDSSFGQSVPIVRAAGISVDRLEDPVGLPYGDAGFDVVLSFGVLEHVQDDAGSLKEIRRVLRPGGLFFCFNLPYFLSWTQKVMRCSGDDYHDRLYRKSSTQQLLLNSGFRVIDMWHRQLLPKNRVSYPYYRAFEALDQFLARHTPLKYLATNIEFVAFAQ